MDSKNNEAMAAHSHVCEGNGCACCHDHTHEHHHEHHHDHNEHDCCHEHDHGHHGCSCCGHDHEHEPSQKELIIAVDLHEGEDEAECWGCDLTYGYVKINGDYRT